VVAILIAQCKVFLLDSVFIETEEVGGTFGTFGVLELDMSKIFLLF
jgi:hypothetical protein